MLLDPLSVFISGKNTSDYLNFPGNQFRFEAVIQEKDFIKFVNGCIHVENFHVQLLLKLPVVYR